MLYLVMLCWHVEIYSFRCNILYIFISEMAQGMNEEVMQCASFIQGYDSQLCLSSELKLFYRNEIDP